MNQTTTTREMHRPSGVFIPHADRAAAIEAMSKLSLSLERALSIFVPAEPLYMTYTEFLEQADEDTLAEWIAIPGEENLGEVIMTSPASNKHQDLVRFLISILGIYAEQASVGIVRPAPFQMKLPKSGREPDVLFVATEHLDRLQKTYLDGPADLVIEIISPESLSRDRGTKFYEYARGGVPEYWLIDPDVQWVEFYQLHGQRYQLAMEGDEGKYTSAVLPDFWLQIEWLWQEPLPPVLDIARALKLIQ